MNWRAWTLCLLGHKGDGRAFENGDWVAKCSRCGMTLPWIYEEHEFEPKLNNLCCCAICGKFAIDHPCLTAKPADTK